MGNPEVVAKGSKPSQTANEGSHVSVEIVKDAEGNNKKVAGELHTSRKVRKPGKPCWLRDFNMMWQQ